jgi:hypothetical protein
VLFHLPLYTPEGHKARAPPVRAARLAACPLSTRGGTRLVRLVRGRGGGAPVQYPFVLLAPEQSMLPWGPSVSLRRLRFGLGLANGAQAAVLRTSD